MRGAGAATGAVTPSTVCNTTRGRGGGDGNPAQPQLHVNAAVSCLPWLWRPCVARARMLRLQAQPPHHLPLRAPAWWPWRVWGGTCGGTKCVPSKCETCGAITGTVGGGLPGTTELLNRSPCDCERCGACTSTGDGQGLCICLIMAEELSTHEGRRGYGGAVGTSRHLQTTGGWGS